MQEEVYTIGYEGSSIEDFVATLMLAEISVLVDIRELPASRKKGFSKNALAEALETQGIKYIHLKGLGDPKEGREAARAGDYDSFLKIFKAHMKTKIAQNDLRKAEEIAVNEAACFLCFERDPKCCHRYIVIQQLTENTKQEVTHLGVKQGIQDEVVFRVNDDYEYECA